MTGNWVINNGELNGPIAQGRDHVTAYQSRPVDARGPLGRRQAGGPPLVFVNYRGDDEPWAAHALHRAWSERISDAMVFLDSVSIEPGRQFDLALLDSVGSCAALLVVVGAGWLRPDATGRRLIDDEGDWVRREIMHALARRVRVVPMFVDRGELSRDELPDELWQLAMFQGCTIRHRSARIDIAESIDRLCAAEPRLRDAAVRDR